MNPLKKAFGTYTAFHVLFGIWMPALWYISWCRETFNQHQFELLDLPPFAMAFGILIVAGCFTATMGMAFQDQLFPRRKGGDDLPYESGGES